MNIARPGIYDLLLNLLSSGLARGLLHSLGSISIAFRIGADRKKIGKRVLNVYGTSLDLTE